MTGAEDQGAGCRFQCCTKEQGWWYGEVIVDDDIDAHVHDIVVVAVITGSGTLKYWMWDPLL